MGIDVGTYSSKGALVEPDGTVLRSHVTEHTVDIPQPGWAEQDADKVWWADIIAICHALLDGHPYTGVYRVRACETDLGGKRMETSMRR